MSVASSSSTDFMVLLQAEPSNTNLCVCKIDLPLLGSNLATCANILQRCVFHAIKQANLYIADHPRMLRLMLHNKLNEHITELTQDPTCLDDFANDAKRCQALTHLVQLQSSHIRMHSQSLAGDTPVQHASAEAFAADTTQVVVDVGIYPPHCKLVLFLDELLSRPHLRVATQLLFARAFGGKTVKVKDVLVDANTLLIPGILAALLRAFPNAKYFHRKVPDCLLSDKQFMRHVPSSMHCLASSELLEDVSFVEFAFKSAQRARYPIFNTLTSDMRNNKQVVHQALDGESWQSLQYASKACKNDIQIALHALHLNQFALQHASVDLQQNASLVCMCLATLPASQVEQFRKQVLDKSWLEQQQYKLKQVDPAILAMLSCSNNQ